MYAKLAQRIGQFTTWAILLALGSSAAASAQHNPGLVTVRVASIPADDMTSVLYAKGSGMFEQAGLDVRIDKATSGSALIAAVIGGAYDIGKSSAPPLLVAYAKGLPLTIVACGAVYDAKEPYAVLLVLADSPIKTGKDLDGKIVSSDSVTAIGRIAMDAWMRKGGGDPMTLRRIAFPLAAEPAALESHRIDAGDLTVPQLSAAIALHEFRMIPTLDAIAPTFLASAWFTTKDYAATHPGVVRTFASVVSRAARYVNLHHQQTVRMLSAWTGIAPAIIAAGPRVKNGEELRASELQPVIDATVRDGVIARSFQATDLLDAEVTW